MIFTLIFFFLWFALSVSIRELTRDLYSPIWWKNVLKNIIIAPSLFGEFIAWHRLGNFLSSYIAAFAAWLTR